MQDNVLVEHPGGYAPGRRRPVLVVIGTGAMGLACARRLGSGTHVMLADHAAARLDPIVAELTDAGYDIEGIGVDVTDRGAVADLAQAASARGRIATVVHTAGISPTQGSSRDIYRVDLLGVAHVLDEFLGVAEPGTVLTVIASIAGYREPVSRELERRLALTPTAELLSVLDLDSPDTRLAYHLAKRGAQLRVQAAAAGWGARGCRVNSISPGIILTPMSRHELEGPQGDPMRSLIENSPAGRPGTADEIAAAVEFLSAPAAAFITGTDLIVDGGATPLRRWGNPTAGHDTPTSQSAL